jgi:hypothetical protein
LTLVSAAVVQAEQIGNEPYQACSCGGRRGCWPVQLEKASAKMRLNGLARIAASDLILNMPV